MSSSDQHATNGSARPRVAFLGLGAMGLPMSRNLLKAGFPLAVWNRTAQRAQSLSGEGATVAATPREAANGADVVLLCVPTQVEVRDLLTREDGVLAGIAKGKTIVDCSTIDPNASRELHDLCAGHGIAFLEAPLSGGTIGAINGTLTLMCAGEAETLERVRDVLEAVGKNIFFLGPSGAGQTVKLWNNAIFAAQMVAVAEAFASIVKAGIDPGMAADVFKVSTANCTAVQQRVPVPGVQPGMPPSNDWKPGFATKWMAKDLHLALEFARSQSLPSMQLALDHQFMQLSIQSGYAEDDLSVVGKVLIERAAATAPASR